MEYGDFEIHCFNANRYGVLEVFAGGDCQAPYVSCDFIAGHGDYDAQVNLTQVQAGDQFLLRGVPMWGELAITKAAGQCVDTGIDRFAGNNDCATPAIIGNGTYTGLTVSTGLEDYYQVCLGAGQTLSIEHQRHYFGGIEISLWEVDSAGCAAYTHNDRLALWSDPEYTYQHSSNVDVDLLIKVRAWATTPCNEYDLTIGQANGCGGVPIQYTFCDPANPNSSGVPTQLEAIGGSGIKSGIRLESSMGPGGQFASLLVSDAFHQPGTTLGLGRFCLAPAGFAFGRYNRFGSELNSLGVFDGTGRFVNLVGTSSTGYGFDVPTFVPTLNRFIRAGETWHFQLWHRESGGGSNFSNGVAVQFATIP